MHTSIACVFPKIYPQDKVLIAGKEHFSLAATCAAFPCATSIIAGKTLMPAPPEGLSYALMALMVLGALSLIDLKTRLLPNALVLLFGSLGLIFHIYTSFAYLSPFQSLAGAATGYGLLWTIRFFANRFYGRDSLGLGDVKLLAAGGLWLGPEGVLMAMTLGAFAGLAYGVGYGVYVAAKHKTPVTLRRLTIPAGPGFAIGLVATAIWQMYEG